MRNDIITDINKLLDQYDTDTLEAVLLALQNIGSNSVKRKICERIHKEKDRSKLSFLYELIIRL